jgi:hypothetical protein
MSITRDRELADLLYNSVNHLSQLHADLNTMNGHLEGQNTALAVVEPKPSGAEDHAKSETDATPQAKALADALKLVAALELHQQQLIKLLIQNHTDATSILNEFEKIRTAKLLNSETFALAHLIPTIQK